MKKSLGSLLAGALLVALGFSTGCNPGTVTGDDIYTLLDEHSPFALNEEEANDLRFMREEEKLARDIYQALYARWGFPVFDNISKSEQAHMNAVLDLLVKYGLEDPVGGNGPGIFTDPALQNLYDELLASGLSGEIPALEVGALIEEVDIIDLEDAVAATNNADVQTVYNNLRFGSTNHLRAFVTNLKSRGVDYLPQRLSEAEYEAIVNP